MHKYSINLFKCPIQLRATSPPTIGIPTELFHGIRVRLLLPMVNVNCQGPAIGICLSPVLAIRSYGVVLDV